MQFILENYLIIIIVGLFFVFALVGYLIDMLRNSKNINTLEEKTPDIKPIEITSIKESKEETHNNNADELLENYNKENK